MKDVFKNILGVFLVCLPAICIIIVFNIFDPKINLDRKVYKAGDISGKGFVIIKRPYEDADGLCYTRVVKGDSTILVYMNCRVAKTLKIGDKL